MDAREASGREASGAGARPVVAAAATALASCGLLAAALRGGWLGPDVGRGDGFCEAARPGLVTQPANTWSNLGFVVAGVAVAVFAAHARATRGWGRTLRAHPGLATLYAVIVVLLGPASAAMHATQSSLGGRLDMLSMYLVAGAASGMALVRWLHRGTRLVVAWLLGVVAVSELVEQLGLDVPLVRTGGNAVFAVFLVLTVAVEVALWRRGDPSQDLTLGLASLAAMGTAFAIWTVSQDGGPWCDPHSWLQGHGAWHLLCALAAYLLFRHHAAEGG